MQIYNGAKNINISRPVLTIGSFDGVHRGHVQVIDNLKRCAGRLEGTPVIMTFDPHPRDILSPKDCPGILTTLSEKEYLLESMGIEHVIVMPFTPEIAALSYRDFVSKILVEQIGIVGLVIGYDHHLGHNREGDFSALREVSEEFGFYLEQENVLSVHDVNVSSTKIRRALEEGDVSKVRVLLGYDYSFTGIVGHGDGVGRTLGFPTANIRLDEKRKLLPADGVYAVRVYVDGTSYGGMLYIGSRPTVSDGLERRIEVHLLGFTGDLYEKSLKVTLLERIRSERKFESTEDLAKQLGFDRREVMERLLN